MDINIEHVGHGHVGHGHVGHEHTCWTWTWWSWTWWTWTWWTYPSCPIWFSSYYNAKLLYGMDIHSYAHCTLHTLHCPRTNLLRCFDLKLRHNQLEMLLVLGKSRTWIGFSWIESTRLCQMHKQGVPLNAAEKGPGSKPKHNHHQQHWN